MLTIKDSLAKTLQKRPLNILYVVAPRHSQDKGFVKCFLGKILIATVYYDYHSIGKYRYAINFTLPDLNNFSYSEGTSLCYSHEATMFLAKSKVKEVVQKWIYDLGIS